MKRILAMLLTLTMLFALAACGGSAPAAEEPSEAVEETEPAAAEEAPAEEPAPAEENYEAYDVRSMADKWEYHRSRTSPARANTWIFPTILWRMSYTLRIPWTRISSISTFMSLPAI